MSRCTSKSKIKRLCGIASFSVLVSLIVTAVVAEQENARPEPTYREIKYSADMSSYRWEADDRILVLRGNVKFVQGDTVVLADEVDYRESTRTGTASGNFRIYDDKHTITAEKGTVNFQERMGALTGDVRMVVNPGRSGESRLEAELRDEIVITCDRIDYYYQEKRAVAPSSVRLVQKQRTVLADSATYFGNDEIIDLVGNVSGTDSKDGHSFSAPRVMISVKENEEWIEAEQATGTFYVRDIDEEDDSPSEETDSSANESEQ